MSKIIAVKQVWIDPHFEVENSKKKKKKKKKKNKKKNHWTLIKLILKHPNKFLVCCSVTIRVQR
jgi:hypothetical protein